MMPMLEKYSSPHSPRSACAIARLAMLAAVALLVTSGCGDDGPKGPPPTHPFELEVSVTDENESPVAKAPVVLDGQIVGYTDREGLFQAVIHEQNGAQIELSIAKMDEYLVPEDVARVETLKLKKSLEGVQKPVPVTMHTSVRSVRTDYLIWIDVECDEFLDDKCADLPVMIDGEEHARTDESGAAHFVFTGVPESSVEVSIDTPEYKPSADDDDDASFVMKPENPNYEVELDLEPEVLVIKERFHDPVAGAKAEERRKKRARRRRIRRRRRAKKRAAKQKKAKKEKEVIELW